MLRFFFYISIIEKRANKDFYFSTKDSKHAMAIKFIMVCYETNDYNLLDLILGISRHLYTRHSIVCHFHFKYKLGFTKFNFLYERGVEPVNRK